MTETFKIWIVVTPAELLMVALSCAVTYVAILIYTRLAGLRSFSKMSAPDFAMTVAVGSLFGSTISSPKPALLLGVAALGAIFFGQWLIAYLRKTSNRVSKLVDNEPLLLMHGSTICDDHLSRANVSRDDLYGKLREANAFDLSNVLAVVFETTGDVTVLHADDPNAKIDGRLLENVIGAERIADERIAAVESSSS